MMSTLYNKPKTTLNTSKPVNLGTYSKNDEAIHISSDDSSLDNETIVQSNNGKIVYLVKFIHINISFYL